MLSNKFATLAGFVLLACAGVQASPITSITGQVGTGAGSDSGAEEGPTISGLYTNNGTNGTNGTHTGGLLDSIISAIFPHHSTSTSDFPTPTPDSSSSTAVTIPPLSVSSTSSTESPAATSSVEDGTGDGSSGTNFTARDNSLLNATASVGLGSVIPSPTDNTSSILASPTGILGGLDGIGNITRSAGDGGASAIPSLLSSLLPNATSILHSTPSALPTSGLSNGTATDNVGSALSTVLGGILPGNSTSTLLSTPLPTPTLGSGSGTDDSDDDDGNSSSGDDDDDGLFGSLDFGLDGHENN